MIVVDSSALLAIAFEEAEKPDFVDAILATDGALIGAPNFLEAVMVVEARAGEAGGRELDKIAGNLDLSIVSFEAAHVAAARDAFRRFGKGRHRASLNFGDCCAYGLARSLDLPLLFKGNDFAMTGIKRAV